MDRTDDHRYLLPIRTPVSGAIVVEVIVELAQGLALEFDGALDEEAVDAGSLLHQLGAIVDEAAVTGHLLCQPSSVLDGRAAVISHLLDRLSDPLDDETHCAGSGHKVLAVAANLSVTAALRCPDKMCQ